jgi:hypothetical protein
MGIRVHQTVRTDVAVSLAARTNLFEDELHVRVLPPMQSTAALMLLPPVGIHLLRLGLVSVAPQAGIRQSPLQRGARVLARWASRGSCGDGSRYAIV